MQIFARRGAALLGAGSLMLLGCDSAEKGPTTNPGSMSVLELGENVDSRFDFLLARYDTDGDRQITPQEYARDGGQFDRLDSNEDGVLNDEDFVDGGGMRTRMEEMRSQRAVAAYFQDDDVNDRMTKIELVRSIAAYDTNRDGAISPDEFAATSPGHKVDLPGGDNPMMRRMLGDGDPYEMIVKKTDTDEDGVLGNDELLAFFADNAEEDVWVIRNPRGGRNRPRGDDADVEPTDGAMIGEMAPDFSLRPPDGGGTVTLSSFRDTLPVALIFGSYT